MSKWHALRTIYKSVSTPRVSNPTVKKYVAFVYDSDQRCWCKYKRPCLGGSRPLWCDAWSLGAARPSSVRYLDVTTVTEGVLLHRLFTFQAWNTRTWFGGRVEVIIRRDDALPGHTRLGLRVLPSRRM